MTETLRQKLDRDAPNPDVDGLALYLLSVDAAQGATKGVHELADGYAGARIASDTYSPSPFGKVYRHGIRGYVAVRDPDGEHDISDAPFTICRILQANGVKTNCSDDFVNELQTNLVNFKKANCPHTACRLHYK